MRMFLKYGYLFKRVKSLSATDWLLFLGALGIVVVIAYALFRTNTYRTIVVKIGEESVVLNTNGPKAWFGQLFYPGMKESDGFNQISARVISVRSYDSTPKNKNVYLTVRLKTTYNRASNQYVYRGKPVLIGSTIRLYLDSVLVDGLVTYVEGVRDPRIVKSVVVEAKLYEENQVYQETSGVWPYVADAIQEGATVTDNEGHQFIKILSKQVEDAQKTVTTGDGRIIVSRYPAKKDVYLKLELQAFQINNRLYVFDDIPILVGLEIPIHLPHVSVYPRITQIYTDQ
jgi:hypothetical protein